MTTWWEYSKAFRTEEEAQRQLIKDLNNGILDNPDIIIHIPDEILSKNIRNVSSPLLNISKTLRDIDKKNTPNNIMKFAEECVNTFTMGSRWQKFFLDNLPEDKRKNLDDDIVTIEKLMDGNIIWSDKLTLSAPYCHIYYTGKTNISQWIMELDNWNVNFKSVQSFELMYNEEPKLKM